MQQMTEITTATVPTVEETLRQEIAELQGQLYRARRETIRQVLDLMSVEGEDFYYNEANDYGRISLGLFTGAGDPFNRFAGEQQQSLYAGGVMRPNGRYRLSELLVYRIEEMILEAQEGKDR